MVRKVEGGNGTGGIRQTTRGLVTSDGKHHQITEKAPKQSSEVQTFVSRIFSYVSYIFAKKEEIPATITESTEPRHGVKAIKEEQALKKAYAEGDTKTRELLLKRDRAPDRTLEPTEALANLLTLSVNKIITVCGGAHVVIPRRHKFGFDEYLDAKEGDTLYLDISNLSEHYRKLNNLPLDRDYIKLSESSDEKSLGFKKATPIGGR